MFISDPNISSMNIRGHIKGQISPLILSNWNLNLKFRTGLITKKKSLHFIYIVIYVYSYAPPSAYEPTTHLVCRDLQIFPTWSDNVVPTKFALWSPSSDTFWKTSKGLKKAMISAFPSQLTYQTPPPQSKKSSDPKKNVLIFTLKISLQEIFLIQPLCKGIL